MPDPIPFFTVQERRNILPPFFYCESNILRPFLINNPPSISKEDYPLADVTLPRVQGRLIVDPQATMNSQKFTIKKHYWGQVNEGDLSKYKSVVDSFANWIMEQQITFKIDQIKEIIEGLSDPISPWTANPYTGERYPDRDAALILLRQELSRLSLGSYLTYLPCEIIQGNLGKVCLMFKILIS